MHAFRHAHASLLLNVGAPATVAKEQMRHADARVTLAVYGHVVGEAQRQAVEKVGEILRPRDAETAVNCAQMRPNWGCPVSRIKHLRNVGCGFDSHRPLHKSR
jgi:hypothetical protein